MIALINNDFYDLTPIPAPDGEFALRQIAPNTLKLFKGDKKIDFGAKYYKMGENARIDPISGEFELKKGKSCCFRAIFDGNHADLTIFG